MTASYCIGLIIAVLIFKLPIALLLAKKVSEPATCTIIYHKDNTPTSAKQVGDED